MHERKSEQQRLRLRSEDDHHPTTIRFIVLAVYQTTPRQAIHQSYNAVVLEIETFRELADVASSRSGNPLMANSAWPGGGLAPLLIMGGVIGGILRSPLTAMMFGIELTHDINALLPLVIGCVAAHTTTVLLLECRRHHGQARGRTAGDLDCRGHAGLLHGTRHTETP